MRLLALALLAGLSGCTETISQSAPFLMGTGPSSDVLVPLRSFEERRFATVVRQRYDFSCGSAALATLLHFHYGYAKSEAAVFNGMWRDGDRAQITRLGFSLLDMKRYLQSNGLAADGYKVTLDQVIKTGVPGIALVQIKGYRHFIVVKGVNEREVLVGDPALGLRVMPRTEFQSAWNGIYFVVNSQTSKAKSTFNKDAQWAAFSRAPLGAGFTDPLSQQALTLTAPFYRDF